MHESCRSLGYKRTLQYAILPKGTLPQEPQCVKRQLGDSLGMCEAWTRAGLQQRS